MPEVMETKKESKPWKGVCCSRCYAAKSEKKKCKCRCHGEHHGEVRKHDIGGIWLSEENRKIHEEWMKKQKKPQ